MRLLTPIPGLGMDLAGRWGLQLPYFSLWVFGEKAFVPVLCKHMWEWWQMRPVWETGLAQETGCASESGHPPPWQSTPHTRVGPHTHVGVTVWFTGLQSLVLALINLTSCQQCPFIPQKLPFFSPCLPLQPQRVLFSMKCISPVPGTNPRHLWGGAEQKSLQWRRWQNIFIYNWVGELCMLRGC